MNRPSGLFDMLKELLGAANPGLATKSDIARLEERLSELDHLVDELEARIAAQKSKTTAPPADGPQSQQPS